jgi:hypothetical protein
MPKSRAISSLSLQSAAKARSCAARPDDVVQKVTAARVGASIKIDD